MHLFRLVWILAIAAFHTVQGECYAVHERGYFYSAGELHDGREYDYDDYDDEGGVLYGANELCLSCFLEAISDRTCYLSKYDCHGIDFSVIPHARTRFRSKCYCVRTNIYAGYLHFLYKDDFPFLKKQIAYAKRYSTAHIFWPENSAYALNISNVAVRLFEDLINKTEMNLLEQMSRLQESFPVRSWYFSDLTDMYGIALCSTCFHYSDYFQVCQDIKQFARINLSTVGAREIGNRADKILTNLAPLFQEMYVHALSLEDMPAIQEELELIQNLYNEWAAIASVCPVCQPSANPTAPKWYCSQTRDQVLFPQDSPSDRCVIARNTIPSNAPVSPCAVNNHQEPPPVWCQSALYYSRGALYVDQAMYPEAIQALSKALEYSPGSSDVLLERAHAYFENGQPDLAMADYYAMNRIVKRPVPKFPKAGFPGPDDLIPLSPPDYARGICVGILEGGYSSVADFGPSLVNSAQGLLHGLWAFACAPSQVSSEFIQASIDLIEAIRSQRCLESLQMVVPEVRDLCTHWEQMPHYDRGRKLGYIVGKYGLDIFIPVAGVKLYGKYRALKAANTLLTLDCMAFSEVWNASIIRNSVIRAEARATAKQTRKLVLANPNQAYHITVEHHLWNRVMTLTGCPKTDCKRIIAFLEEHNVVCPTNCHIPRRRLCPEKGPKLFQIDYYSKQIGKVEVEAVMKTNLSTGEATLINAYVDKPRRL